MAQNEKYDRRIDTLRGTAFLTVFVGHFSYKNPNLKDLYTFAPYGVVLFFCLSGYLLGRVVLREIEKTRKLNIWNFFIRRGLRILPLYSFFLLIIFFLSEYSRSRNASFIISFQEWMHLFTFSYNFLPINTGASPLPVVTWSLSIEEQVYLFFPFLALVVARGKKFQSFLLIILILIVLSLFQYSIHPATSLDRYTATYLPSVIIGLFSAVYEKQVRSAFTSRLTLGGSIVAVSLVLIFLIWSQPQTNIVYIVGILALSLAFPILLKLSNSIGERAFFRPLGWIGRISFGCYLYHWIVWNLLQTFPNIFDDRKGFSAFGWSLGFILTLFSSIFSYRLLELPFLNLRRRFQISETS